MRVLQLGEPPSAANGVGEAIAREELAGLAYMFWGRLIVLGMLAVWAALTVPFERSGLYLTAIVAFALLGAPPYLLARRGIGGTPVTAAFLLLDAGILTYILIVPPSFYVDGWTAPHGALLRHFLAQNGAGIGPMRHHFGRMRRRIAVIAKKQVQAMAYV